MLLLKHSKPILLTYTIALEHFKCLGLPFNKAFYIWLSLIRQCKVMSDKCTSLRVISVTKIILTNISINHHELDLNRPVSTSSRRFFIGRSHALHPVGL